MFDDRGGEARVAVNTGKEHRYACMNLLCCTFKSKHRRGVWPPKRAVLPLHKPTLAMNLELRCYVKPADTT